MPVCVIVDYQLGNMRSIQHKLRAIQVESIVTSDPKEIEAAKLLVLPGVGHFATGMNNLQSRGLLPVLHRKVLEEHTPVIGICLGMQLLSEWSEEGDVAGLGWIKGRTQRFRFEGDNQRLRIPHIAWQTITPHGTAPLLDGIDASQRFYFVHSYHMVCSDPSDVLATTHYGYDFACVVRHGNVFGTQFHPEKSHRQGMRVFRNFINLATEPTG